MKIYFSFLSYILIILSTPQNAHAIESINRSCKVSYIIAPEREILDGGEQVSCSFMNQTRQQLSELLENEDHNYFLSNAIYATESLKQIEKSLEENKDDFWDRLDAHNSEELGLVIGTLGLSSCVPSGGAGCVIAVIGYSSALYGFLRSGADRSEKIKKVNELIAQLENAEKELQRHSSRLLERYEILVSEFNKGCFLVKEYCLK